MIRDIIFILKTHVTYRNLSLALLLSNVGTAFTSIAVYAELTRHGASAFSYSVAFVLGILPGLFTSHFSGWLAPRLKLGWFFIILQLLGAVSLIFPVFGLQNNNWSFLLLAEFSGSCLSGFLAPIYQIYVRRTFNDSELPAVSSYDSYVFTAQFVLGQVVGTLLYGVVGTIPYLFFDCLSYLVTAAWIVSILRKDAVGLVELESKTALPRLNWGLLTPTQQRVLLMIPLLSIVCAPSMSLLPSHGQNFEFQIHWIGLNLTPVLLLLLFRSLGQMLGPLVIKPKDFERWLERHWLLVGCLSFYLSLYSVTFSTHSLMLSLVCVLIAHIASNIVFILSSYGLQRYFSAVEIGKVAAVSFQLSILATSVSSLVAGYLLQVLSKQQIVTLSFIPLIIFAIHLTCQKSPKIVQ